MQTVYISLKTILLFLIIVIVINALFGDKATEQMTLVTLFSMLILNNDKAVTVLKAVTNNLTNNL